MFASSQPIDISVTTIIMIIIYMSVIFLSILWVSYKDKDKEDKKQPYFLDKQSGNILSKEEMLDSIESDDELDSFYYLGDFTERPTK
jgi:hypothetical protein